MKNCAYNKAGKCHALAITVGDGHGPMCDTFWKRGSGRDAEGGDPAKIAGVGACHMSSCAFNERLECNAANINVGQEGPQAQCLTYERG
jgi:hypothetical protein